MTSTQPTPEELTRAAELAPRVAAIIDWACYADGNGSWFIRPDVSHNRAEFYLLTADAFQAVLLALPPSVVESLDDALHEAWATANVSLSKPQWLLTPAGMIATYEALVAQEGGDAL